MFDIGWSELMILGIVALIVVGPKDLPILLRTIGRYTGMLKKQAAEFRTQFDDAMREAELDQLKKDLTGFKDDIEGAVRDSAKSFTDEMDSARRTLEIPELDGPGAHDANVIPIPHEKKPVETAAADAPVAVAHDDACMNGDAVSPPAATAATTTTTTAEASADAPIKIGA
jgi:sec-independent protein translocase protein TatB